MSQPDIITISSYNAGYGQSTSNFESLLANTVVYPKQMILTKFVMPNWIYPFGTNTNTFCIGLTSGINNYATVVTIPKKYWATGTAFASDLQGLINVAFCTTNYYGTSLLPNGSTPVVVSFSISSAKITLSLTAGYDTLFIVPFDAPPLTINNGTSAIFPVYSTAVYKLGFTFSTGTGYGFNGRTSSITADSQLNLKGTSVIFLSASLLGNAINDKRASDGTIVGDDSIFCTIPVNSNFGEMILYNDTYGEFIGTTCNSIRAIKITLYDEDYNILDISNNCYATMEFRATY
jgi:hypothetical protein